MKVENYNLPKEYIIKHGFIKDLTRFAGCYPEGSNKHKWKYL